MNKLLLLLTGILTSFFVSAQVTCEPIFPTVNDEVTIYFHADQGNGALAGVSPVYVHMGVITTASTSPTNWQHVVTTWGAADPLGAMTFVSPNLWKKTFTIQSFFNIQPGETVLQLAFVFRNTNGSIVGRAADGSDIYYDVYPANSGLLTTLFTPTAPALLTNIGAQIPVSAAASQSASLVLKDNGVQVASATGQTLEATINVSSGGLHTVQFIATTANDADTSSFIYVIPQNLPAQDPPAGTELGINYLPDQTKTRLALYAPGKSNVFVIGDFNNWLPDPNYQMRKSLDGNTWWLELSGLTPGEIYRFQYFVDGQLKIADPLSTLVLDPWNDAFIPALTWPNIPAYPNGKTTGVVSLLQTAQPAFNWTASGYQRPKKTDLVVYELLVRDFIARHDYQTLTDTLDYLESLGVTAIELMPVNEFDGNINWGYGPAYHKALDKYYGTPEALKTFIDECHKRDIAVILDVVFNQATGASPLAQLYWDAANNRPAANNPWLNPVATHPFNVFNDFNHESQATKAYVKNCVRYWLEEFQIDGFRFDLSKGFTQFNSGSNVALWGQYDASRVAIWKDYADFIWDIDPETYVILEHFAVNTEEKELAEYGMMFWGNMWGGYKDVALGFGSATSANLTGVDYKSRTWSVPHLIGYMESHDEDRIAYECKTYGNVVGSYNIKSLPTAMRRIEMIEQLFYTVPGPKMLWQFGEMGYDFPINYCPDGSINNNCRTDPKPIRWDFLDNPYRRRLHDVTQALLHLRNNFDAFETTDYSVAGLGSGQVKSVVLNGSDLRLVSVANVGTTTTTASVAFPTTGTWYEYYTGETLNVTSGTTSLSLQAGEYRLYLDQFVPLPAGVVISGTSENAGSMSGMEVYPNPAGAIFAVDFALRESARIQIEVFDFTGKRQALVAAADFSAGEHQVQVETGDWPAGLYLVTLRDDAGGTMTRKLVKR
ncbi:MAG: T9SS type A sorting domain-containing protein [Saprospiraceae bacterium]|nr:T9SS type A sorting domain-containing protein [Saprospiraceae bacterium]